MQEVRNQQGYVKLRLVKRDGKAMAFVEFDSPENAKRAVDSYSGGIDLSTSDTRGIVTFARDMNYSGNKRGRFD